MCVWGAVILYWGQFVVYALKRDVQCAACLLSPQSNVFMYYGLSNYYQNHRRYVKSRDDSQLNGNLNSLKVCGSHWRPVAKTAAAL